VSTGELVRVPGTTVRGKVRVVVADDHPLIRNAVSRHLAEHHHIDIVAVVADADELRALFLERSGEIDVVLCDLNMPGRRPGVHLISDLLAHDPEAKVIAFTANDDTRMISLCLDAGVVGFVSKQADEDELAACIFDAAAGRPAFDAVTAPKVIPALRAARRTIKLSGREQAVLELLAEGLTNNEIAERLYLSPLTIKTHVTRLLTKLEVRDRSAAVAKAFRDGMLS
jgi:DNA-binding NarL/FixJ family response regulator